MYISAPGGLLPPPAASCTPGRTLGLDSSPGSGPVSCRSALDHSSRACREEAPISGDLHSLQPLLQPLETPQLSAGHPELSNYKTVTSRAPITSTGQICSEGAARKWLIPFITYKPASPSCLGVWREPRKISRRTSAPSLKLKGKINKILDDLIQPPAGARTDQSAE